MVDAILAVLRSSGVIRLMARNDPKPDDVYYEMGEKAEAFLLSYLPALKVAKVACQLVPGCIKTYIKYRTMMLREVCEITGIDWLIRKMLEIIKRIPQWIRQGLEFVADIWSVLEEWSRGEFKIGQLGTVVKCILRFAGGQFLNWCREAVRAAIRANEWLHNGLVWLVADSPDIAAHIVVQWGQQGHLYAEMPLRAIRDGILSLTGGYGGRLIDGFREFDALVAAIENGALGFATELQDGLWAPIGAIGDWLAISDRDEGGTGRDILSFFAPGISGLFY